MVLSGLVGGCGSGWVRRVPGGLLGVLVFWACCPRGAGDGGAGSSRETSGPGLPPPPARRSRQLVLGGAGACLLCRCARASD